MRTTSILCVLLMVPSIGYATPIRFTYSGSASGKLGGSEFTDTAFVIRAFGDTLNLSQYPMQVAFVPHGTAEIALDGIGLFEFVTPTYTFVNSHFVGGPVAGMGRRMTGTDLLWTGSHAELNHWDLCTSVGPLTGTGSLLRWDSADDPVQTSGGRLQLFSSSAAITFQVEVAPEPSSGFLLVVGLMIPFRGRR
jgi:hypothetical protein